ncbi:hypothetical protein MIMGU_mgv11b016476mg, partial [Erythranthe guttata]
QEPGRVMKLSYEKMVLLTDNFSESNCIGNFQFGKLYYAKIVYPGITAYFMVKKWEVPENCDYDPGDNDLRLMDYNPKLCDFGCTSGGIFLNKKTYSGHNSRSCYGCIDIALCSTGDWSIKQDVFAFGVILLSLISKRVYTDEDSEAGAPFVFEWAFTEYEEALESKSDVKETEFSLVHKSLAAEDDFCTVDGHKITTLALECVNRDEDERPTMKQVVKSLLKLEIVKQNADFIGVNKARNRPEPVGRPGPSNRAYYGPVPVPEKVNHEPARNRPVAVSTLG